MHLANRAYTLLVLIAVLAIAGTWSDEPALEGAWRVPAILLLLAIALEAFFIRRTAIGLEVDTSSRAFLGRPQNAAFAFRNETNRDTTVQYAPVVPQGFEPLGPVRNIIVLRRSMQRDEVTLLPIRLGVYAWPPVPTRVLGRFGFVWWSRDQHVGKRIAVAPDTLRIHRSRPLGIPSGMRPRRVVGAGSELHQLRAYVPGDPIARIDWKATARFGNLITREFSEDQHLDVLLAIDAGRLSRIRAGRLDRLGLYANIAARFAESATPHDDRVGMLVFSDRILAVCAPERGLAAIARIRGMLEQLAPQSAESDPVTAAMRIRALLKHRSLVVLLTDLDDAAMADQIARAVRLLAPPHLVVVAGVHGAEISELAYREARSWRDPWVALAALERESRAGSQRALLRRLGAPVVATREELLEQAVFTEYERLRRSRRI
jgi:uncharacterized protein (DUF58 family)